MSTKFRGFPNEVAPMLSQALTLRGYWSFVDKFMLIFLCQRFQVIDTSDMNIFEYRKMLCGKLNIPLNFLLLAAKPKACIAFCRFDNIFQVLRIREISDEMICQTIDCVLILADQLSKGI